MKETFEKLSRDVPETPLSSLVGALPQRGSFLSPEVKKYIEVFQEKRTLAKGCALEVLELLQDEGRIIREQNFSERLDRLEKHIEGASKAIAQLIGQVIIREKSQMKDLIEREELALNNPGEQARLRMVENGIKAYKALSEVDLDLALSGRKRGNAPLRAEDLDRGYANWLLSKVLSTYIGELKTPITPPQVWKK